MNNNIGCILVTVDHKEYKQCQEIKQNIYSIHRFYKTSFFEKYQKIFEKKQINIITDPNIINANIDETLLAYIYVTSQPNTNKYIIQFPVLLNGNNIYKLFEINLQSVWIQLMYSYDDINNRYHICGDIYFNNWYDILLLKTPWIIEIENKSISQNQNKTIIASKIKNVVFTKLDLELYECILTKKCIVYKNDYTSSTFIIALQFNNKLNEQSKQRKFDRLCNEINRQLIDNVNDKRNHCYKAQSLSRIKHIGYDTQIKNKNKWFTNKINTQINTNIITEPGQYIYDYSTESADDEQKSDTPGKTRKNMNKQSEFNVTKGNNNNTKIHGKTSKNINYSEYVYTFIESPLNKHKYALITKTFGSKMEILDSDDKQSWRLIQTLKLHTSTTHIQNIFELLTKKQLMSIAIYYQKKM